MDKCQSRNAARFERNSPADSNAINSVINAVGIAFGQSFVEGIGLSWVVATDEHGSEIAVHGLPGKGDIFIYPTNLVAKRWEHRQTHFLEPTYKRIADEIHSVFARLPDG